MVTGSVPILATHDVPAALEFYKDVLGFESSWTWGEPPTFGSVSFANVAVMFNLQPALAKQVEGHQHWFKVEDVDKLYDLHRTNGATIVSTIEDKPWGAREYVVRDLNGYHLRFAGGPGSKAAPSNPFPPGIQIVRRLPKLEEYEAVAGAAFAREDLPQDVLERTWAGVVAISGSDECIGMARIVYDAPGWFSVWDVAVLPAWQGRHVGERIMKEAIALVHDESPGAFLYLFTTKPGFYEKLGFGTETVSMRKV
jgi:uncharacterized glyoxalase superfamily protein PhnB